MPVVIKLLTQHLYSFKAAFVSRDRQSALLTFDCRFKTYVKLR